MLILELLQLYYLWFPFEHVSVFNYNCSFMISIILQIISPRILSILIENFYSEIKLNNLEFQVEVMNWELELRLVMIKILQLVIDAAIKDNAVKVLHFSTILCFSKKKRFWYKNNFLDNFLLLTNLYFL